VISPSTAWTTQSAKRQRRPLWLVEIDTYPYAFTNRKGVTFPDPADPQYTVVEGPFKSATDAGTGNFWDESTKTLYWIGYRYDTIGSNGNVVTLYKLRNGVVSYVELAPTSININASVNNFELFLDGTYFYLTAHSGFATGEVFQFNADGSLNSHLGGTSVFSVPYSTWSYRCLTVGKIVGSAVNQAVLSDIGGRASLNDTNPLTEVKTVGLPGGSGLHCPIIDVDGNCWFVNPGSISLVDWAPGTPTVTSYSVGSSNKAACYVPSLGCILIANSSTLYKFDLATRTVTATLATPYGGMSYDPGGDGVVICGVNKLDPATMTLATNLIIDGFGLPNTFHTIGADTYQFGRPYNSSRDIFYAMDMSGWVWGLRLSVGGATIRPWLKPFPGDIELAVDELNGGSSLSQITFDVIDDPAPANTSAHRLTVDMAGFTFEGKRIWLKHGYVGMNRADLLTCFTGVIDSVDSMDGNNGYTFTCSGGATKLDNVVFTTGDDGLDTDNDHPRTLSGHPMDIVIDLFINELSMSVNEFDKATLIAYRDSVFAGMQFQFSITSPPAARDWIQKQIMTPLGGVMWEDNLGVQRFNFMWPLNGVSSVMSLTKADLSKTPTAGQTELINTISYRYDKDDSSDGSGKYLEEKVLKYDPSLVKYQNLPGQHIIESDGVRSAFQGGLIASLVSRLIFLRYGLKNLTFEAEGQWKMLPLEPFDLILISHPLVPDRVNGTFGITNWLVQVFDRKWLMGENKVQLRVVDASALLKYGQFKIAPDGQVAWTLASSPEKARYMFLSNTKGKMSDGAAAPTLG
jgi:hypothetical protein